MGHCVKLDLRSGTRKNVLYFTPLGDEGSSNKSHRLLVDHHLVGSVIDYRHRNKDIPLSEWIF